MKRSLLTFLLLIAFGLFTESFSQELEAKKWDNPKWKTVVLIDFQAGKTQRAKEIVNKYYMAASKKAGTPTPMMALDLFTGDWDMMVVWDMNNLDEMNWEVSPNDVKWMKAMNEITGSAEKSKAIRDEWATLVNRTTSYLAK